MSPVVASQARSAQRLDACRAKWEPVVRASGFRE
jgi:hypothetical protein